MPEVDVLMTGPLYDGGAERRIGRAMEDGRLAVAEASSDDLRRRVGSTARNPTGRYASRVTVDKAATDRARVTVRGLRYTTWLEGTARRNQSSSFKGYRLIRRTFEDMRVRADRIAEEPVRRAVAEINA